MARVPNEIKEGDILTKIEKNIIQMLANGLYEKQIAAELDMSRDWVLTRTAYARRKVGAKNRAELVAICLRRGLIT